MLSFQEFGQKCKKSGQNRIYPSLTLQTTKCFPLKRVLTNIDAAILAQQESGHRRSIRSREPSTETSLDHPLRGYNSAASSRTNSPYSSPRPSLRNAAGTISSKNCCVSFFLWIFLKWVFESSRHKIILQKNDVYVILRVQFTC